jgi:type VI secretion system protein ImpM
VELTLDVHRDAIRPDDRFLLCSDGLTRVVTEAEIRTWMQAPDIHSAVDGLIKATLNAGAPDNVTVLIAEVHA